MSYKAILIISSLMTSGIAMAAESPGTLDATQPYHPFDPSGSRTDSASRTENNDLSPFKGSDSSNSSQSSAEPPAPPPPPQTAPPRRKTN